MNALMSRINPATQRVLKSLGVNAITTPTIREEGFTSCMPKEDSHSNVTYMVCHYGGRMVSGYNIIKSETYPEGHKPFVRFFGKVPMRCSISGIKAFSSNTEKGLPDSIIALVSASTLVTLL